MELDRVASEIVLKSIRDAVPTRWAAKVSELRDFAAANTSPSLRGFLETTGLELEDLFGQDWCWSKLCEEAGLPVLNPGPNETALRRGCGRMLHVDDQARIDAYRRLLKSDTSPNPERLSEVDRRYLRMLVASVAGKAVTNGMTTMEGADLLWSHPQVCSELLSILDVLADRISHLPEILSSHPNVPLAVHARYTRIEILAAFGVGDGAFVAPWQTGVFWASDAKSDLFAFTLDKTSGNFSPTTRYRDYAISRELVHWESQSVTRADSETGRRYRNHLEMGTSVMLFARMRTDDRAFFFLGPATYVSHVSELPMAVTWKLRYPLPGDLFASFAAAVA